MGFRIVGLEAALFADLHALTDEALEAKGARRIRVESEHAAPCRIALDDAAVGETVILLNHTHQPADTPYRQQGPIFVRETTKRANYLNAIAPALARRTLSLRGFGAQHMMIEADLADGKDAAALIERFFSNPDVAYIHAHYARRGCFAAAIERA
ncbi:MAG TPA: DUF1203 domain-containing protein [Vitreimonas sp.]|uniref:DUF1203 domain-containing protein n=1 Tax=Vitreimonas sp. TaxID=3069702 RepID=UPI002D277A55|nr:DUF1203 domain-containing protein [Vitreimonas sp.]HYD88142.1 DUF1203 domain-containing protein [Vitreimonas sp.]